MRHTRNKAIRDDLQRLPLEEFENFRVNQITTASVIYTPR
jgi:hypothetical protein